MTNVIFGTKVAEIPTEMLAHVENRRETIERRHSVRIPFRMKLLYKAGFRTNAQGMIGDVSEGGVFLVAKEKISVRTPVLLYMVVELNEKQITFFLSGKVVRQEQKMGIDVIGHGIALDPMSESNKRAFAQLLKRITK